MDSAEFLDLLGNANRRRILQLLARKPCYVTEISEFLGVSPKAVIDHLRKLEDAGLVESRTDDRRRKYFSISRHIRLEVTVSPYEFGTKSAYPANSRLDITSCRRVTIELDDAAIEVSDIDEIASAETEADGAEVSVGDMHSQSSSAAETSDETAKSGPTDGSTAAESGPTDGSTAAESGPTDGSAAAEARGETAESEATDVSEEMSTTASSNDDGSVPTEETAVETPPSAVTNGSSDGIVTLVQTLRDFEQLESELSLAQRWTQGRITKLREQLTKSLGNSEPRLVSDILLELADSPRKVEELSRAIEVPPQIVEELLEELAIDGVVYRDGRKWHLDE